MQHKNPSAPIKMPYKYMTTFAEDEWVVIDLESNRVNYYPDRHSSEENYEYVDLEGIPIRIIPRAETFSTKP